MIKWSKARIPATDTGWIIFTFIFVKLYCCLKTPKIDEKEAGNAPFLANNTKFHGSCAVGRLAWGNIGHFLLKDIE